MDPAVTFIAIRGAERVLVVAAAALCVWLGYRLFQAVPLVRSDGKIEIPGLRVTLSKSGPGIFFALFGAWVLWKSIVTQANLTIPGATIVTQAPTPNNSGATVIYGTGAGSQTKVSEPQLRRDISVLNCLSLARDTGIGQAELDSALDRARLALMNVDWPPEWGDPKMLDQIATGELKSGPAADALHERHPECKWKTP